MSDLPFNFILWIFIFYPIMGAARQELFRGLFKKINPILRLLGRTRTILRLFKTSKEN